MIHYRLSRWSCYIHPKLAIASSAKNLGFELSNLGLKHFLGSANVVLCGWFSSGLTSSATRMMVLKGMIKCRQQHHIHMFACWIWNKTWYWRGRSTAFCVSCCFNSSSVTFLHSHDHSITVYPMVGPTQIIIFMYILSYIVYTYPISYFSLLICTLFLLRS